MDELNEYTASATRLPQRKADSLAKLKPVVKKDSSVHAKAFNIFAIPFADLNVEVNVEKLKFNKLWLKDVSMRSRMQEDHQIYIDTLSMQVAGGGLRMNGQLNGTDTAKIYFRSTIKMDNIDLEKMMVKLDHYGQDLTINKNIKGILSGQIKSYFQVHPNFVPIISKAKAELIYAFTREALLISRRCRLCRTISRTRIFAISDLTRFRISFHSLMRL